MYPEGRCTQTITNYYQDVKKQQVKEDKSSEQTIIQHIIYYRFDSLKQSSIDYFANELSSNDLSVLKQFLSDSVVHQFIDAEIDGEKATKAKLQFSRLFDNLKNQSKYEQTALEEIIKFASDVHNYSSFLQKLTEDDSNANYQFKDIIDFLWCTHASYSLKNPLIKQYITLCAYAELNGILQSLQGTIAKDATNSDRLVYITKWLQNNLKQFYNNPTDIEGKVNTNNVYQLYLAFILNYSLLKASDCIFTATIDNQQEPEPAVIHSLALTQEILVNRCKFLVTKLETQVALSDECFGIVPDGMLNTFGMNLFERLPYSPSCAEVLSHLEDLIPTKDFTSRTKCR